MNKYNNPTNVAGVHVTEAVPLDDRLILKSEADVAAYVDTEPLPGIMYDGMVVQFADTRNQYIWVESLYGLMKESYTYPEWADDIAGHNYANKKYNLVLFDEKSFYEAVYETSVATKSIKVPLGSLSYKQLMNVGKIHMITVTSGETDYKEIEFPDTWFIANGFLHIVFDPEPKIGESFIILIH
jgi:hypothetical protein